MDRIRLNLRNLAILENISETVSFLTADLWEYINLSVKKK
jgi:hypothetical protein